MLPQSRSAVIAIAIVVASFASTSAFAVLSDPPVCSLKAADPATGHINVYLNWDAADNGSGGQRCSSYCLTTLGLPRSECCWVYNKQEIMQSVVRAIKEWNRQTGFSRPFEWKGTTSATSTSNNYDVIVLLQDCSQGSGCESGCGGASTNGIGSGASVVRVPLFKENCSPKVRHITNEWRRATPNHGMDLYPALIHEFGHILGIPDGESGGPTMYDCNFVTQSWIGGPTLMFSDTEGRRRYTIWPEDRWQIIQNYGIRTGQKVHINESTNGGATWSAPSWGLTTEAAVRTPAIAGGQLNAFVSWCTSPPCNGGIAAWPIPAGNGTADQDKIRLKVFSDSGASTQTITLTEKSEFPVAIASDMAFDGSPSRFVLVYVEKDNENTWPSGSSCSSGAIPCVRRLKYVTSIGGGYWTPSAFVAVSGGPSNISTTGRAALAYSPVGAAMDTFHLAYMQYKYNDSTDGGICTITYHGDTDMWDNQRCFNGLDGWTRSSTGLGLSCEDQGSATCSLYFGAADPANEIIEMLGSSSGSTGLTFTDIGANGGGWYAADDIGAAFLSASGKNKTYYGWGAFYSLAGGMWQSEKDCASGVGGTNYCYVSFNNSFGSPMFKSWTGYSLTRSVSSGKLWSAWAGD